jgi:putative hydrolase of the HAD superfamily
LFRPHPSVGAVYAQIAVRHGIALEGQAIDAGFAEDFHRALREMRGKGEPVWETEEGAWAFWRRVLDAIYTRLAGRTCPEDCFRATWVAFERDEAWRVFSDVPPALDALRNQDIRMGIVSNFDRRLHKIVQAVGLKDYFGAVLPSTDVGFSKPHPRILEEALRRLSAEAAGALCIGDEPATDVAGAKAVGMRCLLLDRRKRLPAGDGVIHSLAKLPERLNTM